MREKVKSDPVAARIHRAKAEQHYQEADRFRRLGMHESQEAALRHAEQEDSIADKLEGLRR